MTSDADLLLCEFVIPGEAPSTLNMREHWAAKNDRARRIRSKVKLLAPKFKMPAPVCIRLKRTGFRSLDGDNLQGALKAHRDAVASYLRIDDASPLIEWTYEQETSGNAENHGVKVEILKRGPFIVEHISFPLTAPPIL